MSADGGPSAKWAWDARVEATAARWASGPNGDGARVARRGSLLLPALLLLLLLGPVCRGAGCTRSVPPANTIGVVEADGTGKWNDVGAMVRPAALVRSASNEPTASAPAAGTGGASKN